MFVDARLILSRTISFVRARSSSQHLGRHPSKALTKTILNRSTDR